MTRALGPRPAEPTQRQVWNDAGRSIERYRLHNRISDKVLPLGRRPIQFQRQTAFDAASRAIGGVRRTLSPTRIAGRYMRMVSALTQFVGDDDHAHDRNLGRGDDRGHGIER